MCSYVLGENPFCITKEYKVTVFSQKHITHEKKSFMMPYLLLTTQLLRIVYNLDVKSQENYATSNLTNKYHVTNVDFLIH